MKKLSDYLHYYMGGICRSVETGEEFELTPNVYARIISGQLKAKPVLYSAFSLPTEFWIKLYEIADANNPDFFSQPEVMRFLFKSGYDVFGLHHEDLAYLNTDTDRGRKCYRTDVDPKPEWLNELPTSLTFLNWAEAIYAHHLAKLSTSDAEIPMASTVAEKLSPDTT